MHLKIRVFVSSGSPTRLQQADTRLFSTIWKQGVLGVTSKATCLKLPEVQTFHTKSNWVRNNIKISGEVENVLPNVESEAEQREICILILGIELTIIIILKKNTVLKDESGRYHAKQHITLSWKNTQSKHPTSFSLKKNFFSIIHALINAQRQH